MVSTSSNFLINLIRFLSAGGVSSSPAGGVLSSLVPSTGEVELSVSAITSELVDVVFCCSNISPNILYSSANIVLALTLSIPNIFNIISIIFWNIDFFSVSYSKVLSFLLYVILLIYLVKVF